MNKLSSIIGQYTTLIDEIGESVEDLLRKNTNEEWVVCIHDLDRDGHVRITMWRMREDPSVCTTVTITSDGWTVTKRSPYEAASQLVSQVFEDCMGEIDVNSEQQRGTE